VRRTVRTTTRFWATLDEAMPTNGSPSWHDFAAVDLPAIVERLAHEWDDLPPLIPRPRPLPLLIGAGQVVAFYAVEAQLAPDGAIELVGVEIDVNGLE
jgi:hypothetical protein